MTVSLVIFAVLFVVTFLLHKPFDIHTAQKRRVQEVHRYFEIAFVMQGLVLLNMLFW